MDSRVGHKVGLELGDVDVESSVETQRCSERRYHLPNKICCQNEISRVLISRENEPERRDG